MKNIKWKLILIPVMIVSMILPALAVNAAPDPYISEIGIISSKNAIDELESSGYTAVYQNLNYAPGAKEWIYMGYKTGGEAITDLVAASEYKDSLVWEGVTYYPVSDTDLNAGTAGDPVFLYYTKDAAAGSGMTGLATFTRSTYCYGEFSELFGDGEIPVTDTDGNAANLDAGIDGYEIYLFMKSDDQDRQFFGAAGTEDGENGELLPGGQVSIFAKDGTLRDTEDTEMLKNDYEEYDGEQNGGKNVTPGSAIGGGSLLAIAVFLAVAVVIVFIFVMRSNRVKKKTDGEE